MGHRTAHGRPRAAGDGAAADVSDGDFDIPELKAAIQGGSLYFAMAATTRLQLVATNDVGALAALAFDEPTAFPAPTEVAGDELAMAEVAATFARVLGPPVQ
jgi:uncharacterized protein YbjT (DUF2867 family)